MSIELGDVPNGTLQDLIRWAQIARLKILENTADVVTAGISGKFTISFTHGGALVDENVFGVFYFPNGAYVTKMMLFIGEVADSTVTVDFLKNDVETSNIATLATGVVSQLTTFATSTQFGVSDKFSLKVKSCGGDFAPGQMLTAVVYWET